MTRKLKKPPFPSAKQYQTLREAVESGVGFGISRWLKHRNESIEERDQDALEEQLVREVLNGICERFEFD